MSDTQRDPRFYELRNATFADQDTVLRLIEADPTIVGARNGIGETALHFLVVENYREAVEFLVQHGADVNTQNEFGQSAIIEAAQLGYVEMVDLMLRLGAKVDGPELLSEVKPRKRKQFTAILQAHDVAI